MATDTICSNFGALENKVSHSFHCLPIYLPWSDGTRCWNLVFWMLSFKPTFSRSSFTFIKWLSSSSSLSAVGWCHLHIWGYWYFSRQSWFQPVIHSAQHSTWCTLANHFSLGRSFRKDRRKILFPLGKGRSLPSCMILHPPAQSFLWGKRCSRPPVVNTCEAGTRSVAALSHAALLEPEAKGKTSGVLILSSFKIWIFRSSWNFTQ